jgi:hypothetical protein
VNTVGHKSINLLTRLLNRQAVEIERGLMGIVPALETSKNAVLYSIALKADHGLWANRLHEGGRKQRLIKAQSPLRALPSVIETRPQGIILDSLWRADILPQGSYALHFSQKQGVFIFIGHERKSPK